MSTVEQYIHKNTLVADIRRHNSEIKREILSHFSKYVTKNNKHLNIKSNNLALYRHLKGTESSCKVPLTI